MALNLAHLKADLQEASRIAREEYSGSDEVEAAANRETELVAEAIDRFVRSGTVETMVTVLGGTSGPDTLAGTGEGEIV